MTPNEAVRWKGNGIVFYVSTTEKENPYSPDSRVSVIPANTLLAIASGDNKFYGTNYLKWQGVRMLSKLDKITTYNSGIGIGKSGRGWDATGLTTVKKIAEVSDVAYVVDLDAISALGTGDLRQSRRQAKSGAVALMTDKQFKESNMARYREILATRYENDGIDQEVQRAIDNATSMISAGMRSMNMGRYGEISFGTSRRGADIRMSDITNWMSNLMNDYARYVDYSNQAKDDKYGPNTYAEKEKKGYALRIKERIDKFKKNDLTW
jgi:hypothetical protein